MKKKKIEIEIEKCVCGNDASVELIPISGFEVRCEKPFCWIGPGMRRKSDAIKAWNKVMEEMLRWKR